LDVIFYLIRTAHKEIHLNFAPKSPSFYNECRLHQALGYKTPPAAWADEVNLVELPLRLDYAGYNSTGPNHRKMWYTSDEEEMRGLHLMNLFLWS
jgi:hypothetical protein